MRACSVNVMRDIEHKAALRLKNSFQAPVCGAVSDAGEAPSESRRFQLLHKV
jgi:hypothetical protein